ncbi:hypothetical protein QF050_003808 [Arthrobacter sp. SLBN-112]|nr:hypothetical protein [Arthrobacter sp. SLBN-112]
MPDRCQILAIVRICENCSMHSDSDSLFDLKQTTQQAPLATPPITEDQIRSLRDAFAAAGIDSMKDRKDVIESCTFPRLVVNIRELLARDVRPILRRIEERSSNKRPTVGSAWDNREEDTWIDKL